MTVNHDDGGGGALATETQVEQQRRLLTAERAAADLRDDLERARKQLNTARAELANSRVRVGQLERQIAGYDEDANDPAAQKGAGGIPVGGPDLSQVEAIEEQLGMSPTMDQQLRSLGMGENAAEQTQHLLTEKGQQQYLEAVDESDLTALLAVVVQALWKCRTVLREVRVTDNVRQAIAAIDELPMSLFTRVLELDDWDERDLPPIKDE